MLSDQISWCGKLPSHADFIQSHNHTHYEALFMEWFKKGQNHIGQQFLTAGSQQAQHFYVFKLNSVDSMTGDAVLGVIFLSADEQGRRCPFVGFTANSSYFYNGFISDFSAHLAALNFEFALLMPTNGVQCNSTVITEAFTQCINTNNLTDTGIGSSGHYDYWLQFYPDNDPVRLEAEALNPIIYRKLFLRS